MAEVEINPQASGFVVPQIAYEQCPMMAEDKHVTGQYSPIDGLPTELLLHIFHYDDPRVTKRLRLTQVCRRWRMVTIESALLWTSIEIKPAPNCTNESFRKYISLLELQLERAQGFPLDVGCHLCGLAERITVILDLIREKGPFHQWRSLTLLMEPAYQQPYTFPTDIFPNLESLVALTTRDNPMLQAINRTTTSKLRTLDIGLSSAKDEDIGHLYGTMLKHITSLVLPRIDCGRSDNLMCIPANITTIEAGERITHQFPHVRTYKLMRGIFLPDHRIDLQRLTTLIVTKSVIVFGTCRLILPSLRRFVCANITLSSTAVFDAPLLEILEFRGNNSQSERNQFCSMTATLGHPGYLLSPTKSLSLVLWLPEDLIVPMLTRHSRSEKLTLRFDDDATVWRVTGAMSAYVAETGIISPHLTELRLVISWYYQGHHDVKWWKDRAAQIALGRASLRIYGSWDDGETFRLLA